MKPRKEQWGTFEFDGDNEAWDLTLSFDEEDEEGLMFLEDAHDALNRLNQKANKRGRLMKQPRRAESWH